MKRFLLFWTIIAMALAVSAQERSTSNNEANNHAQRETHVTAAEALNVGYTFMRTGNNTRSGGVSKQSMQLVYTGQALDSLTNATTDCYYVFSLQPKGFVIVAADNRVEPILGYSYDNNFVVANMPDHVRGWLGNYEKQIEAVVKQDIMPETETTTKWSRLKAGQAMSTRSNETVVGPLLTTTWDQGQYYNAMCPEDANGPDGHVLTGCVATAIAQIINYHQYPQHGRGSHSYYNNYGTLTVNYDSANYNYTLMPNALTSTSTIAEENAVATLMRDCGVAVNMGYGSSESSTYNQEARAALMNFFKYSPNMSFAEKEYFTNDEWETMLRNDLDAGNPVYYSGQGTGGHAFVCDGYNANGYFSFNFGWGGYCNGWYLTSNVNPGGNVFNNSQSAIFGIVPDANGNVILGQMAGTSTFTVDEPMEFYHIMGHNMFWGSAYTNDCHSDVYFSLTDTTKHIEAIVKHFSDQHVCLYDSIAFIGRDIWSIGYDNYSPFISSTHTIKLEYYGNFYPDGFQLHIGKETECKIVNNIKTLIDTTTVHLSWQENGNATQWEVEYGPAGYTVGQGTIVSTNDISTTIGNLQKDMRYDFHIRSVCSEVSVSEWNSVSVQLSPYWTDVVFSVPDGYIEDEYGNVFISSTEGLAWLAVKVNGLHGNSAYNYEGKVVTLTQDLDLSGYRWNPIGKYWQKSNESAYNSFLGTFDGGNHTISNLCVKDTNSMLGLFGAISSGGYGDINVIIKNLKIEGGLVECVHHNGKDPYFLGGWGCIGGLIGYVYGKITIDNCHSSVTVQGRSSIGALCGSVTNMDESYGYIRNCSTNGTVIGYYSLGGIIGDLYGNVMLENCYSYGVVIEDTTEVEDLWGRGDMGGLVGSLADATIANCYSVSDIIYQTSHNIGLGVGEMYASHPSINNVYCKTQEALNVNNGAAGSIQDTSTFVMTDWNLASNIEIQDSVYNTVLGALNAYVFKKNDDNLFLWKKDISDTIIMFSSKYTPSCYNPSNIVISNATQIGDTIISTKIAWEQEGSSERWEVLYVPSRHGLDSGIIISVTNNPCILDSLPVGVPLDFYVRAYCDENSHSNWVGPVSFIPDKLHWTEVITSQPEGYQEDTDGNVYISSPEGLAWLSCLANGINGNQYNSGQFYNSHIILTSDLDLSAYRWTSIGIDWSHIFYCKSFDGNNHTISGLYCNELFDNQGLFGCSNISVNNLVLKQCNVNGAAYVGAIAGYIMFGDIVNCAVQGNVCGIEAVGGILGRHLSVNNGHDPDNYIANSFFIGNVVARRDITEVNTAQGYIGGICGTPFYDTIINCYLVSEITDTVVYSGIISGIGGTAGSVSNCYYKDYQTTNSVAASNSDITNVSSFSGSSTTWTLNTPPYVNGSFRTDLVDALNAWVDENNSEGIYRRWAADSINENDGFPVFAAPQTYTLTLAIDSATPYGEVSGGGTYNEFDNAAIIHATAQEGYHFVQWNDGNTDNPRTIVLTKDSTLTAQFGINMYSVIGTTSTSVDYVFDFEDVSEDDKWTFLNDNFTNRWYINMLDDNRALYISNDYGTSNDYDEYEPSSVFAYTTLLLDSGQYNFSYDWRCNAESHYDYLRVALIPNSVTLDNTDNTWSAYTLPNDAISLDNEYQLAGQSTWANQSGTIEVNSADEYKMVFHWYNDGSVKNVPPAAVDNIHLYTDGVDYFAMGTVLGSDTVPYLDTVTLTAVPNPGYRFVQWDDENTDNPRVVVATNNKKFVAIFECLPVIVIDSIITCDSYSWKGVDYFESTVLFDTLTNATGCDSVVTLYLTINHATISDTMAVACDNYTWNGTTYAESGDYSQTFTNASGCDSIVTLHLTINYSNTGIDEQTACESFTWIDGVTYTESTDTPTFTLTNAAGCDSVVTLHLTVNYGTHNTETEVACDSYEWNGETYSTSGMYTYEYTNADGCPSVDTLHLTINYSTTGIDEQTACESFTWIDGVTYTESTNSPTFTLTNAAGCDSVVTLHLTVNYGTHNIETEVACDSYEWYGESYSTSGTYTYEYTNADGCPSVDTLYLTINNSTTGIDEQTACESFTWIDGVTYTESTNTPSFTLTNAAGCDSVVTLHLTVNYGTHNAETEVACDSYEWNGETYTTSGTYTYEYTNADGCPSVDTLHLTINYSTTGIDEQTACEAFTWIDGVTYTESTNTPTFTLTNAAGCDSIVTLILTINSTYHEYLHVSACEEYVWNGETYFVSGDYDQTFTAANGCDSVVTLHLTVNYGTHNAETEVVCDSYEWNGETYTTSGTYTYEYTNADGCPSVDTLHLTINYSTSGIDEQTACESFTWIDGVTYTESTNSPTFTLTNAAGCDSVVTLNLTIYESTTSEFSIVTDDPCYTWNDMDYCESGDYIQTFQTIYGCDSIVTLHLTITVGIDGHETVDFKVFPNPTTGVVNVECTMNNVQLEGAEIQVVDMYGKLVDVVGANNYSPLRTAQIDLSLYASGVYFVKLVAEDKTIAVRKVVKQ